MPNPSRRLLRQAGAGLIALCLAACAAQEPETDPELASAKVLPPELVEVRKRMVQGDPVAFADVRSIADHDDGYAAWILAERLRNAEHWELASDMAHYYAVAAASGRSGGINGLVEVLEHPEFDTASMSSDRIAWLEQALVHAAEAGNPRALTYLAYAYTSGTPFGEKPDAAIALLDAGTSDRSAPLALDMATGLLRTDGLDATNARQVRQLLEIASTADSLEAQITTENLMTVVDSRFLPEPQPGDLPYAME
ncbi:hypothetical protein [Tropicimonas marinistellae]|uniref:hypothetical protein n=1 Tax=Tropicimonas marinistellae TaxID=1739787 RepID=UPI00082E823D|nr:hypothetical protein [Tropicimonas marinistellae]